jgi:phosphosulfolactate synthase
MNYHLNNLPERTKKPRQKGFTMAMDKGLSVREAEDFMSIAADHVDIVKLGWATSYVTPHLKDKLKVYRDAGIPCYFGGTLFEAFIIRDQFEDYRKVLAKLSKQVTVLSEVGSKDADKIIPPYQWIDLMQKELDAGAWKVIGEAREGGNVGLFRSSGEVRSGLVQEILTKIPFEKIIWEAPQKAQQLYFLELLGANVNLGNIAPHEVIALEAMRIGLRGDTFHLYLNK